jgi:hypothetical protein
MAWREAFPEKGKGGRSPARKPAASPEENLKTGKRMDRL